MFVPADQLATVPSGSAAASQPMSTVWALADIVRRAQPPVTSMVLRIILNMGLG